MKFFERTAKYTLWLQKEWRNFWRFESSTI